MERPHILVVDDEISIRELFAMILPAHGFDVTTADDGAQAVELVQTTPKQFDLVLCDILMPGIDGFSVYKEIRKLAPRVPIFFVTSQAHLQARANHSGAEAFITKPFDYTELERQLRKQLKLPLAA